MIYVSNDQGCNISLGTIEARSHLEDLLGIATEKEEKEEGSAYLPIVRR